MEAARTCSRLLTPSIHLISGHAHVVSQTAVQVVADVLGKLLVVGITDPGQCGGGDGDGGGGECFVSATPFPGVSRREK